MISIRQLVATYWKNTKDMPFLMRMLCQGAMVVTPLFLVLLLFPVMEYEINEKSMSYAELWSSGYGAFFTIFIALVAVGVWGLAARNRFSRWLIVLAPVVPHIAVIMFRIPRGIDTVSISSLGLLENAATAIMLYFCLFKLRSVREYFDREIDRRSS